MQILFIVPYPLGESPSQRFRFEQYFKILRSNAYRYDVQSYLDTKDWGLIFTKGNTTGKAWGLIKGFLKRASILFVIWRYDRVFVHREITPFGPPLFEWIIAKVFQKKIIYDFDDAIWLTDRLDEPCWFRLFKWRSKVRAICTWSYKVSCGNEYLCQYASWFNKNAVLNPTTIGTQNLHNPELYVPKDPIPSAQSLIIIGWTGSHSTLKYLKEIEPVLQELERENQNVVFLVIADQRPNLKLEHLEFVPWKKETEVEDLLKMDIGIMPLPDDEWSKGKCGFKALQYMALEIPAVVSPVGVNTKIVDHGVNGFIASTPSEWKKSLETLISDELLRKQMGVNGRKKVIDNYSVASNTHNFLLLFE